MALEPTTKILPNWALAGVLATLVGATYFYSIKAVGAASAQVMDLAARYQQNVWYLYPDKPI